eukprot:g29248.t1
MGSVYRITATGAKIKPQSIVAKRVQLPKHCDSIGDQRKKDSYDVEAAFYQKGHAERLIDAGCLVPFPLHVEHSRGEGVTICMTELEGGAAMQRLRSLGDPVPDLEQFRTSLELALCDWRRFSEIGLGGWGDSSATKRVMKAWRCFVLRDGGDSEEEDEPTQREAEHAAAVRDTEPSPRDTDESSDGEVFELVETTRGRSSTWGPEAHQAALKLRGLPGLGGAESERRSSAIFPPAVGVTGFRDGLRGWPVQSLQPKKQKRRSGFFDEGPEWGKQRSTRNCGECANRIQQDVAPHVVVAVRLRPLSEKELLESSQKIVKANGNKLVFSDKDQDRRRGEGD